MKSLNAIFIFSLIASILFSSCSQNEKEELSQENDYPNVLILMADDLGYGDVGFNGNDFVITPNLDQLASEGLKFNRFYSSGPVCSPTRASLMTGMHYKRLGIESANIGSLPQFVTSMGEMFKSKGYTTGHFGKWHLGTMTKDTLDSNRGGQKDFEGEFSPPWLHGFDRIFATEAKVPTYDPMTIWPGILDSLPLYYEPCKGDYCIHFGTYYWNQDSTIENDNLSGDDTKIMFDRLIPFMEEAVKAKQPFMANVWIHTPHTPYLTDSAHRALYADKGLSEQNFYGAVTYMDEQIGRLVGKLKELGVDENTFIFFCSDNGPQGQTKWGRPQSAGTTGGLRGRKATLYEGGIRVPGLIKWPKKIKAGGVTDYPASTADLFPTLASVIGYSETVNPIDGGDITKVFDNPETVSNRYIPFIYFRKKAYIGQKHKLVSFDNYNSDGSLDRKIELYDLETDNSEANDLYQKNQQLGDSLSAELEKQTLEFWNYYKEKVTKDEN